VNKLFKICMSAFFVAIFISMVSCEDDLLGYGLLGRGDLKVHQLTLEAVEVESFAEQIPLGRALTLICGKDSLTESRILLSVKGLDSIAVFDSVKLVMRRYQPNNYTQDNMNINIYPLTDEWKENSCTWEQKDGYTKWDVSGGEYDSKDLIGKINVNSDTVELLLKPDKKEQYNKGIIFVPQNKGFCYLGASENPTTSDSVRYFKPDIVGFKGSDKTKFSSAKTSKYYAEVLDATILAPYQKPSSDTLIGAGYAWRVYIKFSLANLPSIIDITSADLSIKYNNYFTPDDTLQFGIHRLKEPYIGRHTKISASLSGRDSLAVKNDSFTVSMVNLAQLWVDEPDSNFGLLVAHTYLEYSSIFGQERNIYALGRLLGKPKLVITYTNPPEGRFKGSE